MNEVTKDQLDADRAGCRHEGQTMAEYAVVLSVITLGIVTAISLLATQIEAAITYIAGLV